VKWAESRGYDLVYVTNVDLDRDPELLARQRLFLSVGHDEYWSGRARDALEAAVASGTSVAFLSGNSMYWQVRFEPARGSGAPRRTMVCYKTPGRDPLRGTAQETVRFRDAPVNRPENALLGLMYTCWDRADTGWTVAGAHHWIYEGTGVKDGDVIPGIVGYETDRVVDDPRWPTPAGTVRLSHSPVADMVTGRQDAQEAAIREPRPGQFVFAAGTIEFVWGLARDGVADRRVQRMADNVFQRAGLDPASGGTLQRAP
jgi:hypothetical protein